MKKPYELKWRGNHWTVAIGHQTFQVGPEIDWPADEAAELKKFYRKAITTAFDRMLKERA